MNIKETLEEIGYTLREDGDYWRARAVYRGGGNPLSLRISKKNGSFCDFSSNESGNIKKLIFLTTGVKPENIGEDFDPSFDFASEKSKIRFIKKMDLESIGTLVKSYKYFLDRGVTKKTLETFGAQMALSGKMYRRIIFPIYDSNLKVIGISGRSITGAEPKWKHLGQKRNWIFPIHLNLDFIRESRTIVLVEGISDILALWDAGIKNVFCLFGTRISGPLISEIIRLNPKKILIATNNEPENFDIGKIAAQEIERKLSVFFSASVITIALPSKKDFGEQSLEENINWGKQYLWQ